MDRVCLRALLVALGWTIAACSGSNGGSGNPTSPTLTPTPSVSVRSVSVTSAPMSSISYQMTARADMTDGSSRDVTAQSQWTSSDAAVATVSASGMLSVLHSGRIDVRATYQSMTGSLTMTLTAPPAIGLIVLSGIASETPPAVKHLAGVTVRIIAGPATGQSTTTDAQGMFGFTKLPTGEIGLEAAKDGYITWRLTNLILDFDRQLDVVMYPTPPTDSAGATATARCNDGSWSWAQTRASACTANSGIAYTVCPGILCQSQTGR